MKSKWRSSDTLQSTASGTKLMTVVAVMQCVERGQIGLDNPLDRICPDLAELEILEGFKDDGKPKMRKAEKVPTLRYRYFIPWNPPSVTNLATCVASRMLL